ncbi:MAG TPA: WD40 repeat domain-containing protein [Acidobacteriota bacterium]|nr:WD40 repeat domain-containing protein [Acidobacteriota bacterium]
MPGAQFHCSGEFRLEGGISALDVAPHGELCLAGGAAGDLALLHSDGSKQWCRKLDARVVEVRCSDEGSFNVALSEDRALTVVDHDGRIVWKKELQHEAACLDLRHGSNLIAIGNRFGYLRHWSIHGKRMQRAEAPHPIDFIRYSPSGNICALGCEDGRVTLLGYGGERIWTAVVHRMIFGLDVARRANFIIAPTNVNGIIAMDAEGNGVGVYELVDPIVSAEIDDDGAIIAALDADGRLIVLDREARLLCRHETGIRADKLAVDSGGAFVAVASDAGGIRIYRRADEEVERSEFVEFTERRGRMRPTEEDDAVRFLEI